VAASRDSEGPAVGRPYPPSWIDRLTTWIAAQPYGDGIVYLVAGGLAAAALTLSQWAAGGYGVVR
jgi:hypothetical protein